jgi:MFS family permease
MRGRYMAFFGYSWAIPFTFAPTLAGMLMDNGHPNWVWFAAGIIGFISTGMYLGMHFRQTRSEAAALSTTMD